MGLYTDIHINGVYITVKAYITYYVYDSRCIWMSHDESYDY